MSRKSIRFAIFAALVSGCASMAHPAFAGGPLALAAFNRDTGITADAATIQQTWATLQAMGTTKYVGGMLGGLKLDESSLIAGALSVGAGELDSMLGGHGLFSSSAGTSSQLLGRMQSAAGIDLSYLTGSFTAGGGGTATAAAALAGGGASAGDGACDTDVASTLAETGKQNVDDIVEASMSQEYGFSKIGDLHGSGGAGTGFASLGCLDKLFQNAGSDIMFKPPSLGTLTTQLQNWVCGQAKSVQEQVAGAFGGGEIFQTASLGGFFPGLTYGEANDGNPIQRPGLGQSAAVTFGQSFADFDKASQSDVAAAADIQKLYR